MNINELINNGSIELKKNNIRSYLLDSEILLSRVLRKKREELLISLQQDVDKKIIIKFKELIMISIINKPNMKLDNNNKIFFL